MPVSCITEFPVHSGIGHQVVDLSRPVLRRCPPAWCMGWRCSYLFHQVPLSDLLRLHYSLRSAAACRLLPAATSVNFLKTVSTLFSPPTRHPSLGVPASISYCMPLCRNHKRTHTQEVEPLGVLRRWLVKQLPLPLSTARLNAFECCAAALCIRHRIHYDRPSISRAAPLLFFQQRRWVWGTVRRR